MKTTLLALSFAAIMVASSPTVRSGIGLRGRAALDVEASPPDEIQSLEPMRT